jgi:acyl-CoA synthetase (AMP-forming)/AMP-acid ligase II
MAEVLASAAATTGDRINVADRLAHFAAATPDNVAVASPRRSSPNYRSEFCGSSGAAYSTTTFAELDADATRIAHGLAEWGVRPGTRLALLVRPGIEFVTLVFAMLRAGAAIVLVDPGLGRRNLIRCLADAEPEGFVAIPAAQAVRVLLRRKFPRAKWNVTVGRRWLWAGLTLDELRRRGDAVAHVMLPETHADDPAAIIFTSGSTGPPKGVLYTQRMFDTQVAEIQTAYDVRPGGVDLSCFPLFALFNSAMGVTTVLPSMDFSRPAAADPKKLLAAANDWRVTQAFASPAVWRKLGEHCGRTGERITSLRKVFSCGAPVPADVLRATLACVAPDARMHTPYGATECLPVATIEAAEVLNETAAKTDVGAGVCVGRKFASIEWRVIRITDDPIATIDDAEELPPGEIGELIVRGPQASPRYVTRTESNADAKIADCGLRIADSDQSEIRNPQSEIHSWHRMGDVGYLDAEGRFWHCGRKSQRVETRNGPLYTERIEPMFSTLPGVRRAALVGVGPTALKKPFVVVEPIDPSIARGTAAAQKRQSELIANWYDIEPRLHSLWYAEHGYILLAGILFHPSLPVDIRHNSKINREALGVWAARRTDAAGLPLNPDP